MAQPRARERAAPSAPGSSRFPRWLLILGLAAILLFALATLPASVLAGRAAKFGVQAAMLSGSIWTGRAHGLAWRSIPLGNLSWSIRPLDLLRGRFAGRLDLDRTDGEASTNFRMALGGSLRLEGLVVNLPIESLAQLPVGLPPGWRGRFVGRFELIEMKGHRLTGMRGALDLDGLVAPPPRNVSIGSYRVVMPDPQVAAAEGELHARVTDKDGPFSFDGRFTLGADRSFLLEGSLAPRGNTPPELARALALLGPADDAGRRPLSVGGTL